MKRIRRSGRVCAGAVLAAALVLSMLTFFPAAGADAGGKAIEVMSAEAVILETNHKGDIEKARIATFFGLKGDGSVDVRKENTLGGDLNWQGVKSFTTPSVDGEDLVWKGLKVNGSANYLSSTVLGEEQVREVRMRIPLDIEYIYEWNGEIISDPNEKTGQDGHFKLYLRMKNTSKEKRTLEYEDPETGEIKSEEVETHLPLVILPYDWYFDNTVFFNLKADPTGVVVPLPNHYQVGWSIPLFPPASEESNTIWIEADVKDFRMPPLVLSANFIFPQTNQRNTLPEFVAGLKMLYGGVRQIRDGLGTVETEDTLLYGAHAVKEGLLKIDEGLGTPSTPDTLSYGINAVLGGLKRMAAGLPEAQTALRTRLIPGVDQAVAGIGDPGTPNTLSYAIDATTVGLMTMLGGIGAPNVADTALYAISAMSAGLKEMSAGIGSKGTPDTLLYGVDRATMGLNEMATGIGSAAMEDTLLYAMDQMAKGLGRIKAGIGSPTTDQTLLYAMAAMAEGLEEAKAGIGSPTTDQTLLYAMAAMADGLNTMLEGIGNAGTPDTLLYGVDQVTGGIEQVKFGLGEIYNATSPEGQLRQALGLIRVMAPWTGFLVDQLEQGIIFREDPDDPSIRYACKMMSDGIGSPTTPDTILYGMDRIKGGLEQIKEGIGGPAVSDTLLYAVAQVQGGLQRLKEGIGDADAPDTLLYAVDQVQGGLATILEGIGAPLTEDTLLYAIAQVENGLKLMKAGIGAKNKEDTLLYAMSAMEDGLRRMKEGIGTETTSDTLLYALAQVGNGLELMKAGIGAEGAPDTLLYAMAQVQNGLHRMKTGLSSGDTNNPGLKEGLMMIAAGLGEAVAGLGSAKTPDTLIYGASAVAGGIDQVAAGIGSTTTPDTLLYGADQVESGLKRVSEEGINVMYEGLAGNLARLYLTESQLEAIKQRGEEFDHMIGRAGGAKNRLSFIYQTPPTYNYEQGSKSSWLVAGIISLLAVFAILMISALARRRPVLG